MKSILLAVLAVIAMNLGARATFAAQDQNSQQDQLTPAEQMATEDGFDVEFWPPPHHPHPPYPYPHPHPVPPPHWWYECSSEDEYGRVYFERGGNPIYTQRDVHNRCERHSGTYCRDLGCRRY